MSGRSSVQAGDGVLRTWMAYAIMGALLLSVGFLQSWPVMLSMTQLCIISAIMALGLNMQWGYAGLFNAGVMGFAALGGVTAVLVSESPVGDAWVAGGWQVWAMFASVVIMILALVAALRRMPKGRARTWTVALIAVAGFAASSYFYGIAVPAIEAVNPAGTGFLGGLGLPIILSWPVAGLVAAVAAFLIGKVSLGLRADYLAIATLGISEIIIFILKNEDWLTRGVKNVSGLDRPIPTERELQQSEWFANLVSWFKGELATKQDIISASSISVKLGYVIIFAIVLIGIFWLAQRALNSPWGRMMRAIRDNEISANAMGKDIVGRHLEVFILGSAIIGVAGAMLTTVIGQFTPSEYIPLRFTFLIWVMVIVGGSGNNFGSVLGGFLIWFIWIQAEPWGTWAMQWLTNVGGLQGFFDTFPGLSQHLVDVAPQLRLMLMGIVLLLVLRFSPAGMLPEIVPGRRKA